MRKEASKAQKTAPGVLTNPLNDAVLTNPLDAANSKNNALDEPKKSPLDTQSQ